jgi:hypothetical protein
MAMIAEEIYSLPDLDPKMQAMHHRQCYFEFHIVHTPDFYWPPDVAAYFKLRNETNSKFMKYMQAHATLIRMLQM